MGSRLGCSDGRWSLSFTEEGQASQTTAGSRRREPWGGLWAWCPGTPRPCGPIQRERPGVVDEGKTASLGESSLVLDIAQLLIVSENGFWFIYQPCLANVSLPCKLIFALILA